MKEDRVGESSHRANSSQVEGFSKLSKEEKIHYLVDGYFPKKSQEVRELLMDLWHREPHKQKIFDEFAENTLTNYYLPFGVAPNFLINGKKYMVPMVIEESSVVAAASKGAKFWSERGGFKANVLNVEKVGQVHFLWFGETQKIINFFNQEKEQLLSFLRPLTKNMEARGGGILNCSIIDKTEELAGYYQLFFTFDTCDAMGANFINTILERASETWCYFIKNAPSFLDQEKEIRPIMSILSNYTPNCLVKVEASCLVKDLAMPALGLSGREYAEKFVTALNIARIDPFRAVTHNKGIFNGIDAVVIATGNDFRAVEASGHAYASRSGRYQALSKAKIEDELFQFNLEVPLSLGTIGGLTSLHPLARISLELLGNPSAKELMMIAASLGLAQNFGAVNSLITTGIQKGHMKMHLMNILNQLGATDSECEDAKEYFKNETVSFVAVRNFLESRRCLH